MTPAPVWIIALLAALLHLAPFWRAQSQTPAGWTFTGNLKASPDFMQYRVWSRRTLRTGLLVDNQFTAEANPPHLPVVFYYLIGRIARWTGTPPEFTMAYAGAVLIFALTLLLFATVRHFMESAYQTWWVFGAVMLGGGLGAHLKILSGVDVVRGDFFLRRFIVDPLAEAHVFEDFRGQYVVTTFFDTHYVLLWLITVLAVLSLYATVRDLSPGRVLLTALCYAAVTVVHVYESVTLLLITTAVAGVCWRKQIAVRPALIVLGACALSLGACLVWLWSLYRSSGLPVSPWRGIALPFSTLLLAYPLAWGLLACGLREYWRRAGVRECVLLGWALGCVALTLSGPYYPYPMRGALTLQIPLFLIAGTIYFSRQPRVTPVAALMAVLVLGAAPVSALRYAWRDSGFRPNAPFTFMGPEHREIVNALRERAKEDDVLLVDKSDVRSQDDDLWIGPEYPGRRFSGHFFLTVDYRRKRAQATRFFRSSAAEQALFLQQQNIRFIFANADVNPARLAQVPGLTLLKATSIGSLYEFTGARR